MSTSRDVADLLGAEAGDAGCDAGIAVVHRYVDLELSGGDAQREFPDVATHLRVCPACRLDYLGIVEAVTLFGDERPSGSS